MREISLSAPETRRAGSRTSSASGISIPLRGPRGAGRDGSAGTGAAATSPNVMGGPACSKVTYSASAALIPPGVSASSGSRSR